MKRKCLAAAVLGLAGLAGSPALAGWETINLNPEGVSAELSDTAGEQQVGNIRVSGKYHASLWHGTSSSCVDLNPSGASESWAAKVSGGQQVGSARNVDGVETCASLWSGTAESWVNLHPKQATSSAALGVSGGKQVGEVAFGQYWHASMWSGTAASWIDLNPTGAESSRAYGIDGDKQVGYVKLSSAISGHASLWSGTANNWVDLNPSVAWASIAMAVSGDKQVGYVDINGGRYASLWSGTADSWINLNPSDAWASCATDVSGNKQAGYAYLNSTWHAGLWSGTAESWVDLHPTGAAASWAYGVYTKGDEVWVAGEVVATEGSGSQAALWHYTPDASVPEPGSLLALLSGLIPAGAFSYKRLKA